MYVYNDVAEELTQSKMLQEVHANQLVKRVNGTEKEVKEIKKRLHSQHTTSKCRKKDISPVVRVRLYQCIFCTHYNSYYF